MVEENGPLLTARKLKELNKQTKEHMDKWKSLGDIGKAYLKKLEADAALYENVSKILEEERRIEVESKIKPIQQNKTIINLMKIAIITSVIALVIGIISLIITLS